MHSQLFQNQCAEILWISVKLRGTKMDKLAARLLRIPRFLCMGINLKFDLKQIESDLDNIIILAITSIRPLNHSVLSSGPLPVDVSYVSGLTRFINGPSDPIRQYNWTANLFSSSSEYLSNLLPTTFIQTGKFGTVSFNAPGGKRFNVDNYDSVCILSFSFAYDTTTIFPSLNDRKQPHNGDLYKLEIRFIVQWHKDFGLPRPDRNFVLETDYRFTMKEIIHKDVWSSLATKDWLPNIDTKITPGSR